MPSPKSTGGKRGPIKPPPSGEPFCPLQPRSYQIPLLQAFSIDPKTKRPKMRHGIAVWHRRAGKDRTAMTGVAIPALTYLPGNYFHIFPYFAQAKRAIWHDEESFLDRIPPPYQPQRYESEMYIKMTIPASPLGPGGTARYYLLGADDMQTVSKLVGSAPKGVIYSESAQMDRAVRDLLSPALRENQGWELFVTTPRGKNWQYELYKMALENPDWFAEMLTIDQTMKDAPGEAGGPVVSLQDIEDERASGMPEELIQQEYYCSWEGYASGSIYGDLIQKARAEGRVGRVPHDPRKPVGVCLDIGRSDLTAAWFYQVDGSAILWIDYFSESGLNCPATIRKLKTEYDYDYGRIMMPWDARAGFYAGGPRTVEEEFRRAFRCPVDAVEGKPRVQAQIDLVRSRFSRFYFDEVKCEKDWGPGAPSGLSSLGNYHRKWDEHKQAFLPEPVHDQHSHGASAMAVGMVLWKEGLDTVDKEDIVTITDGEFDVFAPRRTMGRKWGETDGQFALWRR